MIWIVMCATGFLTFCMRFSMFSGLVRRPLPKAVEGGLQYVPTAVLSAIIAVALFIENGTQNISLVNHFSVSALVATVAALVSRSVLWTIAVGMSTLWLTKLLV